MSGWGQYGGGGNARNVSNLLGVGEGGVAPSTSGSGDKEKYHLGILEILKPENLLRSFNQHMVDLFAKGSGFCAAILGDARSENTIESLPNRKGRDDDVRPC